MGAQRRGHEPTAAEPLELVALAERLADPLESLRPDADEVTPRQHPLGVLDAGEGRAALAGQRADDRHLEHQVGAQRAQGPVGVVVHREHRHQAVERHRPGVVGHDERAALGRDVVQAAHLEPEPLLRDRAQRGHEEALGQLTVEAVVVDLVVALEPTARERHQLGEAPLPVVTEDVLRRALRGGEPVADGDAGLRLGDPLRAGRRRCGRGDGRLGGRRGLASGGRARRRLAGGRRSALAGSLPRRRCQVARGRRRTGLARAAAGPAAGPDRDDDGVLAGAVAGLLRHGRPLPSRAGRARGRSPRTPRRS